MKRKLIIAFITISFVFASWNLINPSFENSNKDKLLIEIVKYVLEKYHYNSIEINDEFSEKMFDAYKKLDLNYTEGFSDEPYTIFNDLTFANTSAIAQEVMDQFEAVSLKLALITSSSN